MMDGTYVQPEGEFFYRVMVPADSQEEADEVMRELVKADADHMIEFAREGEDHLWEMPGL
jgi:hypothetical protein